MIQNHGWDHGFASRVRGALMGVAIGDAMGMSVEFMSPSKIMAATDGKGVTTFMDRIGPDTIPTKGLKAGDTTDDWQLTRAVARSIILAGGKFDLLVCAQEHVHELNRTTIGWGGTTRVAIEDIRDGKRNVLTDPLPPAEPDKGAGNGVIMKVAPLAIAHAADTLTDDELWRDVRALGTMTHQDIRASLTAYAVALLLRDIVREGYRGRDPYKVLFTLKRAAEKVEKLEGVTDGLVSERFDMLREMLHDPELIRRMKPYGFFHSMYTVTMVTGSYLRHPQSFKRGILEVVNHGGDADSNAAIVGALIGASVGLEGVPHEWRNFAPDGREKFRESFDVANELLEALGN